MYLWSLIPLGWTQEGSESIHSPSFHLSFGDRGSWVQIPALALPHGSAPRSTASQTLVWGGAVVSCTCTPTRTHTSPRAPEHNPRHGRLCPASAHARPGACTHPWARRPCHPHAHTRAVRRRRTPQRTCRVVLPSGESSGRCLPWCGSSAFSR